MKKCLSVPPRRLFFATILVVLAFAVLPSSLFAGGYCAIAYSTSTGRWGDSYSYGSRLGAERAALRTCGAGDAFIAGWGCNRYIALAVGNGGATWGFGHGQTKREAEVNALHQCRAQDRHILRTAWAFD